MRAARAKAELDFDLKIAIKNPILRVAWKLVKVEVMKIIMKYLIAKGWIEEDDVS